MNNLHFMGSIALVFVFSFVSCVQGEGDNKNNEYLRFGRESNNGYIRFGRNDPFLRFGKRNDPFLRFGRQDPFLRFGRQDPFLRFGRQDPFLRFGRQDPFLRFGREDPFLRFGRNEPYLRFGRNDPYLRFGRNDPYLRFGKNDPFLRFGKSDHTETAESDTDTLALSREQKLLEETDTSDRRKRSVIEEAEAGAPLSREARETTELASDIKVVNGKVSDETNIKEIRNAPYMRFGKKNSDLEEDDSNYSYGMALLENELGRFLRNYASKISLPRAGKRKDHSIQRKQEYMRFG